MNNTIIVQSCLQEFKSKNGLDRQNDDDVFELFSVAQLTKDLDLSFTDIEDSIIDGGNDGGIDSFVILVNDEYCSTIEQAKELKITDGTQIKVFINQSKNQNTFKEVVLDKLYISLPMIYDLNEQSDALLKRFNPSLVEKIDLFRYLWLTGARKASKMTMIYSYNCIANEIQINGTYTSKREQIISLTKDRISGVDIKFQENSAKELIELYKKSKNTTLDLKFKEPPIPIAFNSKEYGYVGVVTLSDYFDFIVDKDGHIREHMFESNIRHYQGDVDVNTRIQDTLENDDKRDFWWLNNGATIVASKCSPIPKILCLENPQIVNGLQTSYTLGLFYNKNGTMRDTKRSILAKVIITDDKENIDRIISGSNSQNLISPTLLRATDDVQRKIEMYFITKGYYYDRRKNYYKNQGMPANKIFNIQFTAQAIEAILNRSPSSARSKPTTLIKEDKTYTKIFNEHDNFNTYLNCCIIHQKTKEFIKSLSTDAGVKSLSRNFAYHLSFVLTSKLLSKTDYGREEVCSIDCNKINDTMISSAYSDLGKILREYAEKNKGENIINIAKSKRFDEYLIKEIKFM